MKPRLRRESGWILDAFIQYLSTYQGIEQGPPHPFITLNMILRSSCMHDLHRHCSFSKSVHSYLHTPPSGQAPLTLTHT